MIYLLTRPIAWVFKLVMWIVTRPAALMRSIRDHRVRKDVKVAAQAAKRQS